MPKPIAIILAAGIGSRLKPLTENTPKCLIPVSGKPILQWQIESFLLAGIPKIRVVAGYKSDQICSFCKEYLPYVEIVVNERYDKTNNMYSFYLANKDLDEVSGVLCNGDVVFDHQIVSRMFEEPWGNLIPVQVAQFHEESMKITVNGLHRITCISKAISQKDAYGVSIDLYKFNGEAMKEIMKVATRHICRDSNEGLWTEVAINEALKYIHFKPLDIGSSRWVEIDTLADLSLARKIFG